MVMIYHLPKICKCRYGCFCCDVIVPSFMIGTRLTLLDFCSSDFNFVRRNIVNWFCIILCLLLSLFNCLGDIMFEM